MTKYFVMFLIVISGARCQKNPCLIVTHIPASQRLIPLYDSLHDEAPIADTVPVINAKKASVKIMDSIEIIFHDAFQSIPYIKFGLPADIDSSVHFRYEGAYRTRDGAIYLKNVINHLIAVQFGTVQRNETTRQRAHDFEQLLIHELAHFYHDVVIQRLTDNMLERKECVTLQDSIAFEVVVEGIADWVEMTYKHQYKQYTSAEFFPNTIPTRDQELWREYGLSFVGLILDCNPRMGIEYLVLHPFTIDKHFSQSAKRYQDEAIMYISNHSQ